MNPRQGCMHVFYKGCHFSTTSKQGENNKNSHKTPDYRIIASIVKIIQSYPAKRKKSPKPRRTKDTLNRYKRFLDTARNLRIIPQNYECGYNLKANCKPKRIKFVSFG